MTNKVVVRPQDYEAIRCRRLAAERFAQKKGYDHKRHLVEAVCFGPIFKKLKRK